MLQVQVLERSSLVTRSIAAPTLASPEVQLDDEPYAVIIESNAKDTSVYPINTVDDGQEHT